MFEVNTDTKLVGILGYPLKHSYSPAMQNRAFKVKGLNYLYLPIEVQGEDLGDVVKGLTKMNFVGFNVTVPHKINIMPHLDEIDELAASIGAVNTVVIGGGRTKGYNTDGSGFVKSIEQQTGRDVRGSNIFIIGSGGAARAVSMTLAQRGANKIFICNRTMDKAVALSSDINRQVRSCSAPVKQSCEEMQEVLKETDIVINTTSLGMHPRNDELSLDRSLLDKRFVVCDIVYNPLKTRLLKEAESLGCQTVTGLGMLLYQGAEAYKLWTGQEPPIKEMRETLEKITMKSNIVLTGFSGTGKSSIGKRLAAFLHKDFYDSDMEIERDMGMSIPDIFQEYGEKEFRLKEKEKIREIALRKNCVISTGGGVVLDHSNMEALAADGIIVCLTARPEIILKRVKRDENRPLLQEGDQYEKILRLMKEREEYYKNADIYCDTSDLGIEEAIEKILQQYRKMTG